MSAPPKSRMTLIAGSTTIMVMSVIDYRGPATPTSAFVQIDRRPDGAVEIRVMHPREYPRYFWLQVTLIAIASVCMAVVLAFGSVDWGIALGTTVLTCNGWMLYQQWANVGSAHRWIAGGDGLLMQRVSPAGYLRSRFIGSGNIIDVDLSPQRASGTARYLVIRKRSLWRPKQHHFHGLNHDDLDAIATALRDGLQLPPLAVPLR